MNNAPFSIPEGLLAAQGAQFNHNPSGLSPSQTQLLRQLANDALMETRLPPPEDASGNAAGLSISALAHALLLACFVIGLAWKSTPPLPLQATLFTEMPGLEPTPKTPPPAPSPVANPKPTSKPEPTPKPVQKKADLELDKSKKKPEPKDKKDKVEPKKPEPKPEKKPQPKPEKKPEPKTEPKPVPQAPKTDVLKKLREEEIARAKSSTPSSNPSNSQASTGRNQAGYSDKIRQFVRSRLVFPGADSIAGNPVAIFEVRQMPTGEIISITMKQSSGNFAWDEAIERALQRSSPLPRADDGSVEPVLLLSFRPKDMQ